MSVFNNLTTNLGNWIEVVDLKNNFTIDDFPYSTGVVGPITKKHCAKCVAINKCWFKNEKGKKPEPHGEVFGMNGLYHPNCHCEENYIVKPTENEIELIIPEGKIGWLFNDKTNWINIWGYQPDEKVLQEIYSAVKEAYVSGRYKIRNHNNYGAQITLYIILNGENDKKGKKYKLKSGFTIFPEGKLKCNTLIGGKWNNEII